MSKKLLCCLLVLSICLVASCRMKQPSSSSSVSHRLEWWLDSINWSDQHDYSGKGIRIAILDSGIDFSHEDLSKLEYHQFRVNGIGKKDTRKYGLSHGTAVAGIIAGKCTQNRGLLGVAENSIIYSIDITDSSRVKLSNLIEGIQKAINENVDIINMSIGMHEGNKKLHQVIKKAYDKGIVLIAASGNYMEGEVLFPARYPEVICVGSLRKNGEIISPKKYRSNEIVFLPGEDIVTTCCGRKKYCGESGTSFSTAIATGIVAVMKEANSDLNQAEICSYFYGNNMNLKVSDCIEYAVNLKEKG